MMLHGSRRKCRLAAGTAGAEHGAAGWHLGRGSTAGVMLKRREHYAFRVMCMFLCTVYMVLGFLLPQCVFATRLLSY